MEHFTYRKITPLKTRYPNRWKLAFQVYQDYDGTKICGNIIRDKTPSGDETKRNKRNVRIERAERFKIKQNWDRNNKYKLYEKNRMRKNEDMEK